MLAIFLDIETSGLDSYHHRVLEIAFKVLDVQTGDEIFTYQSIIKQSKEVWEKRDPASVEFNGFTWEKMLLGQEETVVSQEIVQIFTVLNIERGKAVYICQNPAFDRGFFAQIVDVYTQEKYNWPYHWLDLASMHWVLQIKRCAEKGVSIPTEMNLSKNAIAQQFRLPAEIEPHSALNGVNHLILCYSTVVGFGGSAKFLPKS
ncbi:MAG: 3'-5' exonuclease [Candidatus Protochlamydia sp.]|nr:3'-5' exonuclease [Candidatus Protochlamydia sp.]